MEPRTSTIMIMSGFIAHPCAWIVAIRGLNLSCLVLMACFPCIGLVWTLVIVWFGRQWFDVFSRMSWIVYDGFGHWRSIFQCNKFVQLSWPWVNMLFLNECFQVCIIHVKLVVVGNLAILYVVLGWQCVVPWLNSMLAYSLPYMHVWVWTNWIAILCGNQVMRWTIDAMKSLSGWLCCIEVDTI